MSYEQFLQYVVEHIGEEIADGENCRIFLKRVNKNNGLCVESLHIYKPNSNISPSIELNSYYERYMEGEGVREILKEIAQLYEENAENHFVFSGTVRDYKSVKDRIIMRLVNYEKNRQVLEECPHIRILDLAVTFRWLAYQDEIGISTALITNREVSIWEKSCEHLFELAMVNTPRLFPAKICTMREILEKYIELEETEQNDLYILTNEVGIHGAICMFYPPILRQFAEQIGSDFYILPSSIHEVILVPVSPYLRKESLYQLVQQANQSVVSSQEVLSDSVYRYNQEKNRVSIV